MGITLSLVGKVFGKLKVISYSGKNKHGKSVWKCLCDCGIEKDIRGNDLNSGKIKSCGCLKKDNAIVNKKTRCIKHLGERNNRLTIISECGKDTWGKVIWECQCDCGKHIKTTYSNFVNIFSCGCYSKEQASIRQKTHGQAGVTSEYNTWSSMKERCLNSNNPNYKRYGGRGITVCEKWLNFEGFFEDMGVKPTPKHTIDRINNDGNYEQSNCKWATRKEQANNRSSNRIISLNGYNKTVSQLCDALNLKRTNVSYRINKGNWSNKDAFEIDFKQEECLIF